MILLTKIDDTEFNFTKILSEGYEIDEQPNVINEKQMVNGNRKKIVTDYIDCIIKINLDCFDGDTLAQYISKLTDGQYKYYSLKDKMYKNANFIVTLPSQVIKNAINSITANTFSVTLEKSSDVT